MNSREPYFYCALKMPWKAFGILVASVNGKKYSQPRASRACDFTGFSK